MILLITYTERNETTGRMETIVSHGIDLDTGRTVVLPQERPEQLGGVLDRDFGEYIIRDKLDVLTTLSKTHPVDPLSSKAFPWARFLPAVHDLSLGSVVNPSADHQHHHQ